MASVQCFIGPSARQPPSLVQYVQLVLARAYVVGGPAVWVARSQSRPTDKCPDEPSSLIQRAGRRVGFVGGGRRRLDHGCAYKFAYLRPSVGRSDGPVLGPGGRSTTRRAAPDHPADPPIRRRIFIHPVSGPVAGVDGPCAHDTARPTRRESRARI